MAEALIQGMLAKGSVQGSDVFVYDRNAPKVRTWCVRCGGSFCVVFYVSHGGTGDSTILCL